MTAPLTAGKDAVARGAWEEARTQFELALAATETPEVLESLGLVGWWLDDAALTFDSREHAFRLYRERGDSRGAARVALWLVWDNLAFRGDFAVASGWMERARRLLQGHEDSAEYGWLLLREGEVALFREHQVTIARDLGVRAAELGRKVGDQGLEFTGLALEGLAMVSAGDVAAGMRRLDEATTAATAGEVREMHTVGVVCCWQIFACERVRDYDRAAQWCARVEEFTKRWRIQPLSAVCRTQYAGVLIWRGQWAEAESELVAAIREFERVRPPMTAQATARLGDLRLRQGRLDEASDLFARAASHPLARVGQAGLALARLDAAAAAAAVERFLDYVGDGEPTLRAGALEIGVRAYLAKGDRDAAARALDELRKVATLLGTAPFSGGVKAAEGAVLLERGEYAAARRSLEEALDLLERSGAPWETARARLDLAQALAAGGDTDAAEREARIAAEAFRSLGAAGDLARATASITPNRPSPLTGRQVEILRLVAQGLSNPEIAKRLRLSDHTIKRHVANLLTRLGLPSRAAAVAYAARMGLL